MLTAIVILTFLVVGAGDYRPMHKDMKPKEKFWYFALLSLGFCVLLLYSMRIDVPSPAKGITFILDKLFPGLGQ